MDYGVLIKIFQEPEKEDRRKYSPSLIVETKKKAVFDNPEMSRICTSHTERMNGSIRNFSKRLARLTYCFFKKWSNHEAALALCFAHYNYCHKHRSLNGLTPAMAHGLEDHKWTMRELLEKVIQFTHN